MAHPLYNPYASGNQRAIQGQYGLSSGHAGWDPHTASSSSGPGSSFSGYSSVTHAMTVSDRPEQSRATIATERPLHVHISGAGEGMRPLGKPMHQPIRSRLTRIQRECLSSETGMVSYPQVKPSTSASLGYGDPVVESGSSSSNDKRPTADKPSKLNPSPASSSLAESSDTVSSEREHVMQSLPGLGHVEYALSDKPAAPSGSSQYIYSSEAAHRILLHFGLDEDDLDHLTSYPEDQITPANLRLILRQIHSKKSKGAPAAVQLKLCPEPQRMSVMGVDGHGVSPSGRMHQEEMSSTVLEANKVIDCGQTEGAGDETGRSIGRHRDNCGGTGSTLLIDTHASSRPAEELSPDSSLSSLHSSILSPAVPPSNDETTLQIQPNPSSRTILSSSSPPKTGIMVVKSEASKPVPLKQPEADPQPIPEPLDLIHPPLPTSSKQPLAKVSVSKDVQGTAAMTHDGAAASPKSYPHTCCPCKRQCLDVKDWVSHQNSSLHLEKCQLLRKSAAGKDAEPSTPSQTSRYRQKTRHRSRSRSRSPVHRQHHRSEGRREKPGSRSPLPRSYRYSRRSRSGSRSTSSRYRSRSKSPERQRRSRRRDDGPSTPRRSRERRPSPRTTDEGRSPRRRSDRRRSIQRKELSVKDSVAEELLKSSAVDLLSNHSDLKALVNTLAPIILAKLTERRSSSSSSSSSSSLSSSSSSASSP